ncbi:MAG: BlaI/MecI/CopY family transcriptional regulator [Clostridiales bacterium]|nr:BlaI/MecI/CopY family transcriptional regulator [Clostridiales bacterium]
MDKISLSDGEWKLLNLLWKDNPLTIGQMVESLASSTGWTKATVNVMLNRLADKGAVRIVTGGRRKLIYPVIAREEAVWQEARNTLERIRTDSLGLLLSAMTRDTKLSEQEVEELIGILKEAGKND